MLWTLACIALLQLSIGAAIEFALPSVRDPEFTHREEIYRQRLREELGKPTVMLLGSSRVLNGFYVKASTQMIDNKALLFNFGIPSTGPNLEKIWLQRLAADGIKPDILFLEVIPAHFNSMALPPDLHGVDGARFTFGEMNEIPGLQHSLSRITGSWALGRALPNYRHQAELRGHLGIDEHANGEQLHKELLSIDEYGWEPRLTAQDSRLMTMLAHRQYDFCYRDFQLSENQVRVLEENIAFCQRQGIRTVLLLMPEGSEFRNLYSPEMSESVAGMLARLREKYNVPAVDARTWVADELFIDMHHLLIEGSIVFSERLSQEVIGPILRQYDLRD